MRLILIWIVFGSQCGRSRRLRRQALPSQHVQVSSMDSNVMYNDEIYVESTENRIDLKERTVNGSIWSDHSLLNFDSLDTFVNITADNAESYLSIANRGNLHGQGIKTDFYLHSNRTQNGNSAISHSMAGSANFSIEEEALRVQAVNGRKIAVEAETWQKLVTPRMTLYAESTDNHERELRLESIANTYHVLATYLGSTMFINFANKIMRLGNDYQNVEIFTDKYNVTVITRDAPYDIALTQEEVVINLPTQRTRVCLTLDGVSVKSNQAAKTHIERNEGNLTVGEKIIDESGATLMAGTTSLDLNSAGQITADLTNSRFLVDNNIQKVGLVSKHHRLQIEQGFPKITVDPGESCVEIVANSGLPHFADIIPPFTWPEDRFKNIGPFDGDDQKEIEFYNKPSCCLIGRTTGPSSTAQTVRGATGEAEWSEWGNNGKNGGWNSGEGTMSTGTTPTSQFVSERTRLPGTTHGPLIGIWPTIKPAEEPVTRRQWPETFVTGTTKKEDWEKETGCNCRSTTRQLGVSQLWSTSRPGIEVEPGQQSSAVTNTEMPEPATLPVTTTYSTPEERTETVPTSPTLPAMETTDIVTTPNTTNEVVNSTIPSTVPNEVNTSSVATSLTFPMPQEEPTTTEVFPTAESFPTLMTNISDVVTTAQTTQEDFLFAHYASTLFPLPEAITIQATVSSIEAGTTGFPDGFPPPSNIGAQTSNHTEEVEWTGGASDVVTNTQSSEVSTNAAFSKRSPLLLTLRLPENAVGQKMEITNSIKEGLRRVIRRATKRRIAKRQSFSEEDIIRISSIKENNGTVEVVLDMADESPIDEKDLLSLSNQEMNEFFEYPVISLTRVGIEEIGDGRLSYILVSLGAAMMTFFCLCCIFQSIIKQMSQSLLVSLGQRFQKQAPADITQYPYQAANAPY